MTDLIKALDALDAGDWDRAHAIAQDDASAMGSWLHALLHRIEGDAANAGYWYRRAGRVPFTGTHVEEAAAIREAVAKP